MESDAPRIWPPARELDKIAHSVAEEWGVSLSERFSWARYSFAAPANGAVLKVSPPDDDEADHEADALEAWDGDGAVRLLRRDVARRAFLIERAIPGHDARSLSDVDATRAAVAVGRRLWRLVPRGPFRSATPEVARWLDRVAQTKHRFVPIARQIFDRMDLRERALVHGDLHHYNLLRHGDRWVAIDPKPLIAEPEFDVVTLLWNPLTFVPTPGSVERRIRLLEEAGLDGRRVRDWAIVRGTYLGLPLDPHEDETTVRQLSVVRCLVET